MGKLFILIPLAVICFFFLRLVFPQWLDDWGFAPGSILFDFIVFLAGIFIGALLVGVTRRN